MFCRLYLNEPCVPEGGCHRRLNFASARRKSNWNLRYVDTCLPRRQCRLLELCVIFIFRRTYTTGEDLRDSAYVL